MWQRGKPSGPLLISLPITGRLASPSLAAKIVVIEAEATIGWWPRERGLTTMRSQKMAARRERPLTWRW
jgi:hypothetical protein